ncbi:MAG: hypothetical protein QG657_3715 [Acidobacteriota bacterium]|nr:hypothetical protein [Acidobacteriota bacterium]
MLYFVTKDEALIYGRRIEINVVYHCNLSCRACAHFSPISPKYYLDPNELYQQLSILAKCFRVRYVELLGGEPLLHPQLIEIARAVRESGVTRYIRIITNGLLLEKMKDIFWKEVDEIHISEYPGKEMTQAQLDYIRNKAELLNVNIEFMHYVNFREVYSSIGTNDAALIKRIYKSCQCTHRYQSFTFAQGYFYKCPLAFFIPLKSQNIEISDPTVDGVKIIDVPDLREKLLQYLESPNPLNSCKYCLGSVGKLFPHETIPRKHWHTLHEFSTEQLIDMKQLDVLENISPDADNGFLKQPYPQYNYLDVRPITSEV